jgi:ribonuclease P protein component
MAAVSKKYLKRAVKRNLVRRRIKEAFRQSPNLLQLENALPRTELHLAFVYVSKEVLCYQRIEEVVNELLGKLIIKGEKGAK